MLDDQKYIARFDVDDALGVAERQLDQLRHEFTAIEDDWRPANVVLAGMGGSALAAMYVTAMWPDVKVPFLISRSYEMPHFIGENSLVLISSYSGNTEESLSALEDAASKGAKIVAITSGGKLGEISQQRGYQTFILPSGVQPRMSYLYQLKALSVILDSYGLTTGAASELEAIADQLSAVPVGWRADVPTSENLAKQIAESLVGKTPIIYGGLLYPAAYKWKISFNENAKNTAWCGEYSEFNHNEFLGWSSHPIEKPFGVIDLISSFDHPRIQKRFELSDRLLSGKRPKARQIYAEGESAAAQLIWATLLGDMVSIYLAILNGVNPTPVDLIESFKQQLDQ